MLKVVKFGGSSLASRTQFEKVKAIVQADAARQLIVVSALGKRHEDDQKITDLFYVIYSHVVHDIPYDDLWDRVASRFVAVKKELNLRFDIEQELALIKAKLDQKAMDVDALVSRGEYLTARLMAEYLGFPFIDAGDFMTFKPCGHIDEEKAAEHLKALWQPGQKAVIPGFYGVFANQKIRLFGRGGSDITGAIVAKITAADIYENFTDVSGMLMADPRIVNEPKSIETLSYEALSELTHMGATVMHDEAVNPCRVAGIPIHIKNTNAPEHPGTVIADVAGEADEFKGVSGKKGFLTVSIYKQNMASEVGFLEKTLGIFSARGINIEHVPTGIDHAGVVVSVADVKDDIALLVRDLKEQLNADEVVIKEGLALISIVAGGVTTDAAVLGKIFTGLAAAEVLVPILAQSPRKLSLIIGVDEGDFEKAIKTLYNVLV